MSVNSLFMTVHVLERFVTNLTKFKYFAMNEA